MLASRGYRTKKELKEAVGQHLCYSETSLFGEEYTQDGVVYLVGPSAYNRKWYAEVWIEKGIIRRVK